MLVEPSLLQTAYDAVDEVYGVLDGYLRDGLGLDDDVVGPAARLAAERLRRVVGVVVRLLRDAAAASGCR